MGNVDASVMFRRWKDSKDKDKEYENIIKRQVQASKIDAEKDGVVVPVTMEEYCMKAKKPSWSAQDSIEMDDFYDDDCYDMDNDYSDEESLGGDDVSEKEINDEDSGNGEESWKFNQDFVGCGAWKS